MVVIGDVILLMVFLQLKHLWCDFYIQTDAMVRDKGTYGKVNGIFHSLLHALTTMLIIAMWQIFTKGKLPITVPGAALLVFVEFLIHYHTDWLKMKLGKTRGWKPMIEKSYRYDMHWLEESRNSVKQFWRALGVDQLVHQLNYVLIVYVVFC